MTMIVLRLLSRLLPLVGLKSRWHRHFSRDPLKVLFQGGGGGVSLDSWTPGPKPLCHRHPTGPHPSGLAWTPATADSTNSDFALATYSGLHHPRCAEVGAVDHATEAEGMRIDDRRLARD